MPALKSFSKVNRDRSLGLVGLFRWAARAAAKFAIFSTSGAAVLRATSQYCRARAGRLMAPTRSCLSCRRSPTITQNFNNCAARGALLPKAQLLEPVCAYRAAGALASPRETEQPWLHLEIPFRPARLRRLAGFSAPGHGAKRCKFRTENRAIGWDGNAV
jgi:hypothetical protein